MTELSALILDFLATGPLAHLVTLGPDGGDPRFTGMLSTPGSGASPGPLSADGRGFAVAWHPASG